MRAFPDATSAWQSAGTASVVHDVPSLFLMMSGLSPRYSEYRSEEALSRLKLILRQAVQAFFRHAARGVRAACGPCAGQGPKDRRDDEKPQAFSGLRLLI